MKLTPIASVIVPLVLALLMAGCPGGQVQFGSGSDKTAEGLDNGRIGQGVGEIDEVTKWCAPAAVLPATSDLFFGFRNVSADLGNVLTFFEKDDPVTRAAFDAPVRGQDSGDSTSFVDIVEGFDLVAEGTLGFGSEDIKCLAFSMDSASDHLLDDYIPGRTPLFPFLMGKLFTVNPDQGEEEPDVSLQFAFDNIAGTANLDLLLGLIADGLEQTFEAGMILTEVTQEIATAINYPELFSPDYTCWIVGRVQEALNLNIALDPAAARGEEDGPDIGIPIAAACLDEPFVVGVVGILGPQAGATLKVMLENKVSYEQGQESTNEESFVTSDISRQVIGQMGSSPDIVFALDAAKVLDLAVMNRTLKLFPTTPTFVGMGFGMSFGSPGETATVVDFTVDDPATADYVSISSRSVQTSFAANLDWLNMLSLPSGNGMLKGMALMLETATQLLARTAY